MEIQIQQLAMHFGGKELFEGVNLQLKAGHRYGLIGANGSGKSTFLQILAKERTPEKGQVLLPNQARVGTLRQDPHPFVEYELIDVVLMGNHSLWKALKEKESLLHSSLEWNKQNCDKLEQLEALIESQQGYSSTSRAAELLEGLGITQQRHQTKLKTLSGGYQLRVLLAQLLFAKPTHLLLDEPTNHLDLFSIRWLEDYLLNFNGLLVVCSHDRLFLQRIVTDILDVDYSTITLYPGGYESFVETKQERQLQRQAAMASHQKKQDKLQTFVDRFGAKATKARQAQSKEKLIEKIEEKIDQLQLRPSSRCSPHMRFTTEQRCNARVLAVEGLCKSYGEQRVLGNISFEIEKDDRAAFVGVNGIGKTTLLEIITGRLKSDGGTARWGEQCRWDYFPQDPRKVLPMQSSPLRWLESLFPQKKEQELRAAMGQFLLGEDEVNQPIETLSGGERARLLLAKMALNGANVLLFDEPTNHLDLESIDALIEALNAFNGCVMLVSHNRWLVGRFANRIIELRGDGILDCKGSYDEFIEKHDRDLLTAMGGAPKTGGAEKSQKALAHEERKEMKRLLAQNKKMLSSLEKKIGELEKEIGEIDQEMARPDFFTKTPGSQQKAIAEKKRQLEIELQQAQEGWERLFEEIELNPDCGLAT